VKIKNRIEIAVIICEILFITIACRQSTLLAQYKLVPFWSYISSIKGNYFLAQEIILNMIMFVPVGFFLASQRRQSKAAYVLLIIAFSACIEVLQLVTHRGLFEFDDIFSNTIGGCIGYWFYGFLRKRFNKLIPAFNIMYLIGGLLVCFLINPQSQVLEKEFEFQATAYDGRLEGNCFVYGKNASDNYTIIIRNRNKNQRLATQHFVDEDLNSYFGCEYDYSDSGFTAVIPNIDGEILVEFPVVGIKETGCYLINGKVVRYSDSDIEAGGYLREIVENGYLLVAQDHCYVYQYNGELYWIADEDFEFEEDGSTYIQYQLWTTQTENLPESRLENGWEWDNIGFYFEENELEPYDKYRVAKKSLPVEYPITAIVTGYHKNGFWVWQKYFRPVLSELIQ